jgi:hypothetical protein
MRLGKGLILLFVFVLSAGVANAQSVSDSDFITTINPTDGTDQYNIPANDVDTNFAIAIMIDNATILGAISIPLDFSGKTELNIDTTVVTPPDIKGVTYGPAGGLAWTVKTSLVNNTAKTILMGFVSFAQFNPTNDTLCYVHFDLDASGSNSTITVDSTFLAPANRLVVTDIAGPTDYTPTWQVLTINIGGVDVADHGVTPLDYGLDQNFPNPFNAQTKISFSMPKAEHVNLVVYNLLGQHVRTLVDQKMEAAKHDVTWDGNSDQGNLVASGTYFYRLKIGDAFEETLQMTLLK